MGKLIDLTGQTFGKLTVVKRSEKRGKEAIWTCLCECGKSVDVRASKLKSGNTQSCGCIRKKDITNQRFGRLMALHPNGQYRSQTVWHCKCDCGKEVNVPVSRLLGGHTQSCGCLRIERAISSTIDDLTGRKFEKLLVLEKAPSNGHCARWKCQCDCGNICVVSASHLKDGHTKSCGCLFSKGENKIKEILKTNNIFFESQKTFDLLRGEKGGFLRFDFYIPEWHMAIEYQGQQHFEAIDYWGGEEKLQLQQANDERKRIFCRDKRIILIEIPYWDYEKINFSYLEEMRELQKEIFV